jgi:hypothetical protein
MVLTMPTARWSSPRNIRLAYPTVGTARLVAALKQQHTYTTDRYLKPEGHWFGASWNIEMTAYACNFTP